MELKKLIEQRAELQTEIETLLNGAKVEERAMSDDESTKFDELETKIKNIDRTIQIEERARDLKINENTNNNTIVEERAVAETQLFAGFLRGAVENRADVNMTFTENGAVIPSTIANRIIKKVYDICPVYQMATKYSVKGNLVLPYYDETTSTITMDFVDEFTPAESKVGEFNSIELKGYLGRALSKVSLSLINNSQFDIVTFVVDDMAQTIARFLEKVLLKGVSGKVDGLTGITQLLTTTSATTITGDELVQLKDKVKDAFQNGAVWVMNSATRTAIRLLKDGNERYLFQDDVNSAFGGLLLGKPVYVSDQMDTIAAGKTPIYYGDLSGLAVKVSEEINIQVLREKYAEEHAIGVLGFVEMDSKVENAQKLAKLVMKAA